MQKPQIIGTMINHEKSIENGNPVILQERSSSYLVCSKRAVEARKRKRRKMLPFCKTCFFDLPDKSYWWSNKLYHYWYKKCPPRSPAVLWFVNGHEKKKTARKKKNKNKRKKNVARIEGFYQTFLSECRFHWLQHCFSVVLVICFSWHFHVNLSHEF